MIASDRLTVRMVSNETTIFKRLILHNKIVRIGIFNIVYINFNKQKIHEEMQFTTD